MFVALPVHVCIVVLQLSLLSMCMFSKYNALIVKWTQLTTKHLKYTQLNLFPLGVTHPNAFAHFTLSPAFNRVEMRIILFLWGNRIVIACYLVVVCRVSALLV